MFMNYSQYNSYKARVLDDLYNKKVPNMEDYLTDDFSPDDFADLIKNMEADGLITNVKYVHGVQGHNHIVPSFEHVVVLQEGISIVENDFL